MSSCGKGWLRDNNVVRTSQGDIGSGKDDNEVNDEDSDDDDVDRGSQSNIGSGMWGSRIPICLHCTTFLILLLLHYYPRGE